MAISTNLLLLNLSGSLGDQLTIKNYSGKIVVCKKIGKRSKKASSAQQTNEALFKMANTRASNIYKDPALREEARLRLKTPHGNPLYRALLKECRESLQNE